MAFKRTTQRQSFVKPVQNAPSSGDMAMSNMFGEVSNLFGNLSQQQQVKDKKEFANDELWRAYKEAPVATTSKDGVLSPAFTGSLIDYAKNFSTVPGASNAFFKMVSSTVTSQITNDITAKAKNIFTNAPYDKKGLEELRIHVDGVKSVWQDSPSIQSAIANQYDLSKKTLETNINNNIADRAFDQNKQESVKSITIASEQLNNLAYHNKTAKNDDTAKALAEKLSEELLVLRSNPKIKSGEIEKIEAELMSGFTDSYYRGVADKLYINAETDEDEGTTGLDALNKLKVEMNNYDGKEPLPFGMTKDGVLASIQKVINERLNMSNMSYTQDKRQDATTVGKYADIIAKTSDLNKLELLEKEILRTKFNFSGNTGALLKSIKVRKGEIITDDNFVDKSVIDQFNTDLELISRDKKAKHSTYEKMLKMYNDNELPIGISPKFVQADDKRNKIRSKRSIIDTEVLVEEKFNNISEHNTPEKMEKIIKEMSVDLPSETNKDLIIASQNRLRTKLKTYTVNYEKMIQKKNKLLNIKGNINNGSVLESSDVEMLFDEWTNEEGIDFGTDEGIDSFLGFVLKYKHFPSVASTKFNGILLSGNKEEIVKVEKMIMASHRMLTIGEGALSPRAAKERIFTQLQSGDSNSDRSGRVRAFLEARFAEVPLETAIELTRDGKISSGNSKLKGMATVGTLESANKEDVIQSAFVSLKQAMAENDNFIIDWVQEIVGFGSKTQVKAINEYLSQFGDNDVMMTAIMQPGIKDLYYNTFLATFSEPHYSNTKQDIMNASLATAIKLRGSIGFATTKMPNIQFNMLDPKNYLPFRNTFIGNNQNQLVRFVKNPITHELNKTRPHDQKNMPDMPYYQSDLKNIFSKAYLNKEFVSGTMRTKDALEAINGGHLLFHAQPRFGNLRSYEVYGVNKEGAGFKLMSNYTPNYHTMKAKEAWNSIQDNGVKTALGNFDANLALIGLPIAQQSLQTFLENTTSRSPLLQFIDFVNKTSDLLGLPSIGYDGMNDSQKADFRSNLQNYFNLIKPPNVGFDTLGIGIQ